MALRPLSPVLLRYLHRIQQSTIAGTHRLARKYDERSQRSVYRWRRALGSHLLAVPSIAVESFGLVHAHIFIREPAVQHCAVPYAIEAAWGTPDLVHRVLYLHCLVPREHRNIFARTFAGAATIVWSTTGWQMFVDPIAAMTLPVSSNASGNLDMLRRYPLIVPVLSEMWVYPNTMPAIWNRITARVPNELCAYVRQNRVRHVNGKSYVQETLNRLAAEGLIVQHIIRYDALTTDDTEVFVSLSGNRETSCRLLEELHPALRMIEAYPTEDGYLCRLLGPRHLLVDAISSLADEDRNRLTMHCVHITTGPAPTVRFAYEQIFDAAAGTWHKPTNRSGTVSPGLVYKSRR